MPPFSFEPDAAYLCGLYPEQSNAGMKIWRKEIFSSNLIFDILSKIPYNSKLYRQVVNKILKFINLDELKYFNGNLGCIPFNLLKYFANKNLKLFHSKDKYYNLFFYLSIFRSI